MKVERIVPEPPTVTFRKTIFSIDPEIRGTSVFLVFLDSYYCNNCWEGKCNQRRYNVIKHFLYHEPLKESFRKHLGDKAVIRVLTWQP